MFNDSNIIQSQFSDILRGGLVKLSTIKPSDWVERNVVMGDPFPGPYRYSKTPYCREIIDCLAEDHPARWVAVMKGLQVGLSSGVIVPGLLWTIKESPCNTYFTVGAPDLVDKAAEKLDLGIDRAGIRDFIKPQVMRKRSQLTGDKNEKKDFAGGYIVIASANNHKNWRDVSLKRGFFDDFEAVKASSNESGSTRKLIEGRFAAYKDTHKIFYISTPERKDGSNIEPAYLLGDQRKFLIPCPHCHEFIEILWTHPDGGGMHWDLDNHNNVIDSSVGYVCQKCAAFFKDNTKDKMLNDGKWNPTAVPSQLGYYSYHLSSLYAPSGMYDWKHYVHNYMEANPIGQPQKKAEYKTFVNTCLGLTYEESEESPEAKSIMHNQRRYDVGTIPESISIEDGNGKIIMLTCAADINGKLDDGRLDYEIVAWSESGATYSVMHGSVGTFIPRESGLVNKVDRERWTYSNSPYNNIWAEFEKILSKKYPIDDGKVEMKIFATGLDCGYLDEYALAFIQRSRNSVFGVKGDRESKLLKFGVDVSRFKQSLTSNDMYILQVGLYKDMLADYMQLFWDRMSAQPANFMNYPQADKGKYGYEGFFEHYEAEQRRSVTQKDGSINYRWVKKTETAQNHFFDCRVYNMAIAEIVSTIVCREHGIKKPTWADLVSLLQ